MPPLEDTRTLRERVIALVLRDPSALKAIPPFSIRRRSVEQVPFVTSLPAHPNDGDEVRIAGTIGAQHYVRQAGAWLPLAAPVAVTLAVDSAGPLSVSGSFTKHYDDSILLVHASGSGFHNTGGAVIGADVQIDASNVTAVEVYTNEASSHKAFKPILAVVTGIAAGSRTLGFVAYSGTQSDANDGFHGTVIELFAETS